MLTLIDDLRRWRAAGHRVGLLAMQQGLDVDAPLRPDERQRMKDADAEILDHINDRSMADALATTAIFHRGYTIVALAGSRHAAIARDAPPTADAGHWASAGQWLARMEPVFVVGLQSEGGTAWICTSRGCGEDRIMAGPLHDGRHRLDAEVNLGRISASPPAGR